MKDAIDTPVTSLVLPVSCDGKTDDEFFNAVCKRFPRVKEVYKQICEKHKSSTYNINGFVKSVPIKKGYFKYGNNNVLLTFVHDSTIDEENIRWEIIRQAFWNIADHHPYIAFYMKPEYQFTKDEKDKFRLLFSNVFCDRKAVIYREGAEREYVHN